MTTERIEVLIEKIRRQREDLDDDSSPVYAVVAPSEVYTLTEALEREDGCGNVEELILITHSDSVYQVDIISTWLSFCQKVVQKIVRYFQFSISRRMRRLRRND